MIRKRTGGSLLSLFMLCGSIPALADDEFLVFPGVIRQQRTDLDAGSSAEKLGFTPFANFFYSAEFGDGGRYRFLIEDIVTPSTHEIQRLQIGWQAAPDHLIWLGRYHTPVGYWNTEYHHGQYLQTSVTRPATVNFEGADGILPTHFTGLLFEGSLLKDTGGALDYVIAAGATASFESRLRPLNVTEPGHADNETGAAIRISWRPDALSDNQYGLFLADSTFEGSNDPAVDEINQKAAGVFVNWSLDLSRFIGELVHFDNAVTTAGIREEGSFVSGYAQMERQVGERFTAFGRYERTTNAATDPYLQLSPDFAEKRAAAGVRYDFRQWQALTLEVARRDSVSESYTEIYLQWSALLP